jgi:hypothetical protein
MKRKLLFVQVVILAGGTVFAWFSWIREYLAYCQPCGNGTSPFVSPCFYGAIGFTITLILTFFIVYLESKGK